MNKRTLQNKIEEELESTFLNTVSIKNASASIIKLINKYIKSQTQESASPIAFGDYIENHDTISKMGTSWYNYNGDGIKLNTGQRLTTKEIYQMFLNDNNLTKKQLSKKIEQNLSNK